MTSNTALPGLVDTVPRMTLTPREFQVANLVSAGLRNRDIARHLTISERTAQNHVQHILMKLGFTNRCQIVSWILHQQLGH